LALVFQNTTYPPEVSLTTEQERIVSEIRTLIGDYEVVNFDFFGNEDFSGRVFQAGTSYKFEDKSWPLKVTVSGIDYTTALNPTVNNFEWLIFSSSALEESTFKMFYKSFRFSDQEILDSYDHACVILSQRSIPDNKITEGLKILQAALILLEGELSGLAPDLIRVQDGRTEYEAGDAAKALVSRLEQLRDKFNKAMLEVRQHVSLLLDPIRVE
jgi:hypothetical protein